MSLLLIFAPYVLFVAAAAGCVWAARRGARRMLAVVAVVAASVTVASVTVAVLLGGLAAISWLLFAGLAASLAATAAAGWRKVARTDGPEDAGGVADAGKSDRDG